MAGRPTKPLSLVQGHRTKAEKAIRAEAESKLITGINMKEWPEVKEDPIAHKEFIRVKKVLKSIDKDDALHESIINRYCMLLSECKSMEKLKDKCNEDLEELSNAYAREEIDFLTYVDMKAATNGLFLKLDKKIMDKRKMMFAIEKENIMTIQSALRSIPKVPEKQTQSKMSVFLEKRSAGNGS